MNIEEAREKWGSEYDELSDESIQAILDLIRAVCRYVISSELGLRDKDDK